MELTSLPAWSPIQLKTNDWFLIVPAMVQVRGEGIVYDMRIVHVYTMTRISLDRFAVWFPQENRSRLIPVTVYIMFLLCLLW